MKFRITRIAQISLCLEFLLTASFAASAARPNIVFIMCDDLGYGDIHCLAPETSKIATPGADRLAAEGMIFTDAHSGSSVCTPTRYGLMTGRYSWRTKLQRGVVTGFAPSLIARGRPTVASFLKGQGYHTAIVGKWHLDFLYLDPQTGEAYKQKEHKTPPVGAKIPDGPIHRGFDYYHGFHHARNMKAVIEDDKVIAHDDVINMLPRLTRKSVAYIESRAGKRQPFFLYVPLGSPHTPIVPSAAWQGKSPLGSYGDFVMETDAVVTAISDALEKIGQTDNTLLIFTSDNGCSKAAGIENLRKKGHLVSAHLRGSKAYIWDGGHRNPFIARWPGKIQPGSTSDQLVCLTDLFATVSDITGKPLPAGAAEDSVSYFPALGGKSIVSTRHGVIHHSISGHFAYRQGKWKLALARASGGWSSPKENQAPAGASKGQLYDMAVDPGETTNLYESRPEIVKRLLGQLKSDIERGRSTDGADAKNDFPEIVLWKSEQKPRRGGDKKKGQKKNSRKKGARPK
ncbi:MAG: arylsulfatase [Proteobacteria bacterium]|nr:arylsulfatase [Pseudomonadota bacterium]